MAAEDVLIGLLFWSNLNLCNVESNQISPILDFNAFRFMSCNYVELNINQHASVSRHFHLLRSALSSLGSLDQSANALCVRLGMAVAGKRIGTTTGFNQNIRPDDARLDVDGGDLGEIEANLVFAEL